MKYITTKPITRKDYPWMKANIAKGTEVYECKLPTYGCVREFPATLDKDGGYPFFEIPNNAVKCVR